MDEVSIIKIAGDSFYTGTAVCADCGKDFSFCLSAIAMISWLPLCYEHGEYKEAMKFMQEMT